MHLILNGGPDFRQQFSLGAEAGHHDCTHRTARY